MSITVGSVNPPSRAARPIHLRLPFRIVIP
jgi:hypothetical protein